MEKAHGNIAMDGREDNRWELYILQKCATPFSNQSYFNSLRKQYTITINKLCQEDIS